jgi:hypothetical protein
VSAVQILFQKVDTGYKSREEEEEEEEESSQQKDKEKKEVKQGGVEVLVEKTSDDSVQVRARRCEIGKGTIIKEMSEETILKELQKALDVWKKEHAS